MLVQETVKVWGWGSIRGEATTGAGGMALLLN
jgi:hypothetical protein